MRFVAHTLPGEEDEEKCESIYSTDSDDLGHLNKVAQWVIRFVEEMTFDAPDAWVKWGICSALWHDLGKFSLEFQEMIRFSGDSEEHSTKHGGRVDHSTAGAKWSVDNVSPKPLGDLLAYVLAGHHGGLPNGLALFGERWKKPLPEWLQFAPEKLLSPVDLKGLWKEEVKHFIDNGRRFGFTTAMQIRMLFSCLVDADFLATESFMNPNQHRERPVWGPDILPRMSEILESALAGMESENEWKGSKGRIASLRAEIHHSCYDKASGMRGVYRLNVPTGGGKTLSSLSFALKHAVEHGMNRVIYVIPYTSIVDQTAREFRKVFDEFSQTLGNDCVLEHHSNIKEENETTRSKLITENWDAPLIVTTNVQFFESLFAHRTSACRKLHRIARSVVIFDEAQALPSNLLAPCMEAMKSLHRDFDCTLVLCTATQPALMKRDKFPIGWEDNEVKSLLGEGQEEKLGREMKRIRVEYLGALDTVSLVSHFLEQEEESALLIVNTTRQAQHLYQVLQNEVHSDRKCLHLSARMCPLHREAVLKEVRELLNAKIPVTLVATRVVEAGVDISFPVVYRDQAGIDSLAQAAGRCNRHGEMPNGGFVYSFESSDYPIPPVLADLLSAAIIARDIRETNPEADMLAPGMVLRFFEHYYTERGRQTNQWDEHEVLNLSNCQCGVAEGFRTIDFPEIARRFQMIPGGQHQLMIPWGKEGEQVLKTLQEMEKAGILPNRNLFRRIQSYSIQIYEADWRVLDREGRVKSYAGWLIYTRPDCDSSYDPDTGFLPMKDYDPNKLSYIS